MKLLILFALLAVSTAQERDTEQQVFDDLVAAETVELMKDGVDLKSAASAYKYYPNQNSQWNQQNSWNQPQNNWNQQNTWNPPQETKPVQPVNTYVPPATTGPQYYPPQQTYYPSNPTWSTTNYHPSTTTTPIPVIKNEQYYGDNGSYKYEYQIADGTHVGEEGYFTDPKATDESIVKKGWYSFTAADGKVYTVTYWADKTGFHAYGDHLPTPPPVPAAIQAAMDKENQQNQQQQQQQQQHQHQHPTYTEVYYTTTPVPYYPNNQYYPNQQYYPNNQQTYPQTQPGYGK